MRALLTSAALSLFAFPAFADSVAGLVVAFDRVDHIIVLEDKTIWTIPTDFAVPENLKAGDMITIEYDSNGDNGVGKYLSITRS